MHSSFKADLVFLNLMSRRGFKKVMLNLGAVLGLYFQYPGIWISLVHELETLFMVTIL